jgi:hypothetical protein
LADTNTNVIFKQSTEKKAEVLMQKDASDQWKTPLAPGTLYFTSDDRIVYDTINENRVIISNYPDKTVLADTATIALYDGSKVKDSSGDLIPISERFINF